MTNYDALKAAVRDLVKAAGGPVRAATQSRADPARLSRYGQRHETMNAPIDVIADLEQDVGEPIVTRILADLAGFDLVPKASATDCGTAMRQIGIVAKASGSLINELAEATEDGVYDEKEARLVKERARYARQIATSVEDHADKVIAISSSKRRS